MQLYIKNKFREQARGHLIMFSLLFKFISITIKLATKNLVCSDKRWLEKLNSLWKVVRIVTKNQLVSSPGFWWLNYAVFVFGYLQMYKFMICFYALLLFRDTVTLESRINVPLRLLIFETKGYCLITDLKDLNLLHKFTYFKELCLFFLSNFPGATFIQGATSIPNSRVVIFQSRFRTAWNCC